MLQHPRERDVPINTARIAELCLSNSELHVGVEFATNRAVQQALANAAEPPVLLFPGTDAADLRTAPPAHPVTLVVLDGTWWHASKLFKSNPELRALPCYSLAPSAPSRYRIRREPALHCISTIEALASALSILEGRDVSGILEPFDRMVELQLEFMRERAVSRHNHHKNNKPRGPRLSPLLSASSGLVVGYGEANAWPRRAENAPPPEVLHWAAERLATGERFEAYIAPRHEICESFWHHNQLAPERILAGESFESFRTRWTAFFGEDDVLCGWGFYASEVLRASGLEFKQRFDLRAEAMRFLRRKPGDMHECARDLNASVEEPWAAGRTGFRLSSIVAVARALAMHARP
jgi:DTW domain-containing protein YfiP